MRNRQIHNLCLAAVFAAVIYVFTALLHVPTHTGYTHVGDAFVYLAASLLPMPYAMAAGAIGAALSDLLTGYAMWAPASAVIKALTAMAFTSRAGTILCRRNFLALIPALALCAGGYYGYECLITGNAIAPLAGIPGYCVQVGLSAALYLAAGKALDRMGFKTRYLPPAGERNGRKGA